MEKLSLTGKSVHSTDDTLKGLSAVFVDGDRIFIDNGAIHAKSELERSVTFCQVEGRTVESTIGLRVLDYVEEIRRQDGLSRRHAVCDMD